MAGAGLALLAAAQPWATAAIAGLPGRPTIEPAGRDLAPLVSGFGLAALAGGLAILAAHGVARLLVGAFLVVAGLGIAAGALNVAADLDGSLQRPATEAAGHTSPAITDERMTAWPVGAAAGGGLVAVVGLATLARGRRWPGLSGRYERSDGTPHEGRGSLWEALSRGDDPTT